MKPQIQIPVPSDGVRDDVNALVQTGQMAAIGENCIYFDGTIRPRPALTQETAGDLPETNWPAYTMLYSVYENEFIDSMRINSACVTSLGYIILSMSDLSWRISIDKGRTWEDPGWIDAPAEAFWMEERNGVIFLMTTDSVYRALPGALPYTLDFELVAATGITVNRGFARYEYIDDYDCWIISDSSGIAAYIPMIAVVYDASGAATASVIADGTDDVLTALEETFYTAASVQDEGCYCNGWYVFPAQLRRGSTHSYQMLSFEMEWSGSSFTVPGFLGNLQRFEVQNNRPNSTVTVKRISDSPGGASIWMQKPVWDGNRKLIWTYDDVGDTPLTKFCSVDVLSTGIDASSFSYNESTSSWRPSFVYRTEGQIVYGIPSDGSYGVCTFYVSNDSGETWIAFDNDIVTDSYNQDWFFAPDYTNRRHLMFSWVDFSTNEDVRLRRFLVLNVPPESAAEDHSELWTLPITQQDNAFGVANSMTQADLDDEDNVIILGTTTNVLRLDTVTGRWSRITALGSESVSGSSPDTWVEAGDIPPLGASQQEAEYEDGTTIDGSFENPWVFRTFEAQGKTFLVGTNGQSYPIIYHSEMAGGFARRLGEVPPGDPNDAIMSDPQLAIGLLRTGNLAPKARCIASAANRLMLGNNPNGSPFEVNVGGFNDPDRGWGTLNSQLVLLGDTQGELVTMNEISALQVAMYKTDAIYHAIAQTEFLGVAAPFRFELSKIGIAGPCSPASVLRNFDGRHIYLARDGGVYMYDGVAPLDGGRNIRRMIQDKIDLSRLTKVWGMVDRTRKLVWFFFPVAGGNVSKGIVISTDQGYPWPAWPISLPRGWDFAVGGEIELSTDAIVSSLNEFDSYDQETISSFASSKHAMMLAFANGTSFTQKWDDNGDYSDAGLPIRIHLRTGWTTPGQVEIYTADDLYHIFSSPDPEQELEVQLRAQQIGQNIRTSHPSPLSAGKLRRKTRHRVSGAQFAVDIQGNIKRIFNWGGAAMTLVKRGDR